MIVDPEPSRKARRLKLLRGSFLRILMGIIDWSIVTERILRSKRTAALRLVAEDRGQGRVSSSPVRGVL